MAGRWAVRWLDLGFSVRSMTTTTTSYFLRWPHHLTTIPSFTQRWVPQRWWWSDLSFSIVDDVVWGFITAFESVALVSMLGFFFLFCGCTL